MVINKELLDSVKSERYLMDYNEILLYVPEYDKKREELKNLKVLSKDEALDYFYKNYKNSKYYKDLLQFGYSEKEIFDEMYNNCTFSYFLLNEREKALISRAILMCDLIDYIGHYPNTYPVPKKEELDERLEEKLEEYDIMVRYYAYDDCDEMQITAEDLYRIVSTLYELLLELEEVRSIINDKKFLITRHSNSFATQAYNSIYKVNEFPKSSYQERGESSREVGKMYLRRQHGKDVI